MVSFYLACYIFCLILSVVTHVTGILAFKILRKRFSILPKNLKLYLLACALPFTVSLNLATIFLTIVYIIHQEERVVAFDVVRQIVAFSSQQIRNSLFVIVIERVVATTCFQKYTLSSKGSKLFWWLSGYSYISTTVYVLFSLSIAYTPIFRSLGLLPIWIMFGTHFLTLTMCPVLYYFNRRMYNLFAYQINLQSRYQIFENIKVLSFIFPPILIYTLLAPFGSILRLALPPAFYTPWVPYCSYLIFYNLGLLLIIIQQILGKTKDPVFPKTSKVATVTNAFGKQLPAIETNDNYFRNLKQQWT